MNRQTATQTHQQKPTATPTTSGLLQRKCACGNHTIAGGECEECSKNKRLGLQTKLTVNEPGDVYEQEADRVADQVMAMPSHAAVASAPPRIQRLASQPVGQTDAAPPSVDRILASPGKPLEPSLRQDMEQRFGHDFSRVRVHTGTAAEQSAWEVNAQAYTVGRDMVFGRGRFAPGTHEGRRLIAHELTHVVQQSGVDGLRVGRSTDKRGLSPITPIIQGAIARQSIQRAPLCPDKRDTGEVTKSRSPAGILAVDTGFEAAMGRLSVQDFGIDQDSVPPTMTESDDWRRMMSMILGDPTTKVGVLGFSDCIGNEEDNQGLRGRRAEAVVKAMPAEAQAKVVVKGWWGSLSYVFPNDTAENRARNRMVQVTLMRSPTDSCDGLAKAANIDQFIFLVSCVEKRLGLTKAADAPKTLSLLRQLYFGNASWSTQRNRSRIWDDIITDRPWAPGDDPTPKLGAKLLDALQASKEVKFDSSASSKSIEVSHLLTGLDAMMKPQITTIKAAGPIYVDTEVINHALATWAGDVASAATNYTICVDHLKFSGSYDDFFKSLAEDADLEGDIDAYAVWAALNSAPGAPVPLQLNLPVSEVLMQYYRLKNTHLGQDRATRFEIFANYYGADVKGGKMQNRLKFQQNIYPTVSQIAVLLLGKIIKEGLQGTGVIDCADAKPPVPTGQPAPDVHPFALMARVQDVSVEMIERFTIWLERRL